MSNQGPTLVSKLRPPPSPAPALWAFHAQKQTGERQRSFHETPILNTSRFVRKRHVIRGFSFSVERPQVLKAVETFGYSTVTEWRIGYVTIQKCFVTKPSKHTENIFSFVTCVRYISNKIISHELHLKCVG